MDDINPNNVAKTLEWDSSFFGKRIARVEGNILTPEQIILINTWASQQNIDCLYFLASPNDDTTVICAEKNGYHLVDLRVTLLVKINKNRVPQRPIRSIRFAEKSDIPALKAIAGLNHTNSRFFTDHHFDREKCRLLYETWIEKCVCAENDHVLVWDDHDQAVAYVTTRLEPNETGIIELVGIAPQWQGKGIGKQLISSALSYFTKNQTYQVITVTQGRNIRALNLYQKSGFSIQSIELWYHKWFEIT